MTINSALFTSNSIEWETPPEFFERYNTIYNFTCDVCATQNNAKCDHFYTKEDDALSKVWTGVCWMNPPYGRQIKAWIRKAYESSLTGTTVVCLVPARTDTTWWHDYAMKGTIEFIRGRLKFSGHKWNAPFPVAVVIFGGIFA